ncbi:MAG: prepilin-type N-terminal cleavage/methylation domain-containing protein [Cyanobacterium sp. T60_A2020_053]|nr:prepilin-type N-terminal cleavage/methylation domain-containing protein [Cyanobacterium sp. T60_A2020_053]
MKLIKIIRFLRQPPEEGFTLLEATIAMFLLSLAMLLNLPFAVLLQQQNITYEAQLGASSLSKELLDEIRARRVIDPVDGEARDNLQSLGYDYDAVIYICTDDPIVTDDLEVTDCPTGNADTTDIRYIVIQINRDGQTEPIHTIQTVFTRLIPPENN